MAVGRDGDARVSGQEPGQLDAGAAVGPRRGRGARARGDDRAGSVRRRTLPPRRRPPPRSARSSPLRATRIRPRRSLPAPRYFYHGPRHPAAVTMAPAQGFPSGQRGRAVNPLAQPSEVRILSPALSASAGSARADPARGVRPPGGKPLKPPGLYAAGGARHARPAQKGEVHPVGCPPARDPLAQIPPAGSALRAAHP